MGFLRFVIYRKKNSDPQPMERLRFCKLLCHLMKSSRLENNQIQGGHYIMAIPKVIKQEYILNFVGLY